MLEIFLPQHSVVDSVWAERALHRPNRLGHSCFPTFPLKTWGKGGTHCKRILNTNYHPQPFNWIRETKLEGGSYESVFCLLIISPKWESSSTDDIRRLGHHKVRVVSQRVDGYKVQVQVDPTKLVEQQVPSTLNSFTLTSTQLCFVS